MKNRILLLLVHIFIAQMQGQEFKKAPNILFIAIDDLKPTLGSYGDRFAITPNLDKLAASATIFLNNHTQQAVCGPSRASLMTGKRPDYTKVRDLKTKMRDMNPGIVSIPQYFKSQGYTTIGTGKIYDPRCVDKEVDGPSWSEPFLREFQISYPNTYGKPELGYYQNAKIKAKIVALRKEAENKGVKNVSKYITDRYKPPFEKSNVPDAAYTDGAIALDALKKIDKLSKSPEKPFFLAVGFKRPHLPFVAPQKYWDLYDRTKIDLAAYQKKSKNGTKLSYHNSGEMRSYKSPTIEYKINKENLLELDTATQRELIHGYYACVSFVDTQIGKIRAKLKEKKLDKNTIIVVWGDHGWHLGDHSLWNKHSNFEQATRSPLIIYTPFSEKYTKVSSPTEFVDVFPTLCELSGLKTPSNLDGVSLAPLMKQEKQKVKDIAVSQWRKGKNTGYSFRSENYRYTAWLSDNLKSTSGVLEKDIIAEELYDYKKDPLETTNFVGNRKYKKIYQELKKKALEFFKNEATFKGKVKLTKTPKEPIKTLLKKKYNTDEVFIGATLNYSQLGTFVEKLFLREFTYTTPENCAKQSRVHPEPNVWDWSQIDAYVKFASKNNIAVRIHGPVSPQASRWAKADHRTPEELDNIMTEFFTALCLRFNTNKTVKWMDVVNETVNRNGTWFAEKPGFKEWENPWTQMGLDKNGVPLYITKAFKIANKYAKNKSLVYNQHGGMEPVMWEKVKKTILYLRKKGYRVDGIGWQAHFKSTEKVSLDKKSLDYFSELIDWAHKNKLDFHVTEIDYKIWDGKASSEALKLQAEAYANILKILLSKKETGVVTYNTWGMVDGVGNHKDKHLFLFDKKGKGKPAYKLLKQAIDAPKKPLYYKS